MILSVSFVVALASVQIPPLRARPRDPWVFRSVLDERPRMVTFALNDEMWAAYDATTCALYKAWKGGVHFDGAVYTTVHGPQPTSEGKAYTEGGDTTGWELFVGDKPVESKARWKGYVFHDGRCTMNYELELPDGHRIGVLETPEFVTPEDLFTPEQRDGWALRAGQPGLMRSFFASEMPENVKLTVRVRTDLAAGKFCELEERATTEEVPTGIGPPVVRSYTHVVLHAGKRVNNMILFFAPITEPEPAPGDGAAEGKKAGGKKALDKQPGAEKTRDENPR